MSEKEEEKKDNDSNKTPAVGDMANSVPGADVALAASGLGPVLDTMKAFSALTAGPKLVESPDLKKFNNAMQYEQIKPIIETKMLKDELFQKPENDNTNLDLDKKNTGSNMDYRCKQTQTGGNPLELEETRLKECIQSKLDCKHIKEMIVKKFEQFVDTKVVHPHFHSVSKKTNNLNTVSIFYRHGLSKIVSKIMDDVKNKDKPDILKFFLDEIMENIENMEDEKLMEYIYGFDANLIFELVNDENIKKLADENIKNKDKMCRLLVELYPEPEFNTLINDLMVNNLMTREEMEKWRMIYNDFQMKEKMKEDAAKKEEYALIEKMGINNVLKIFNLKPKKKEIKQMYTDFVNAFTTYDEKMGGKRKTIKRKSKPSK